MKYSVLFADECSAYLISVIALSVDVNDLPISFTREVKNNEVFPSVRLCWLKERDT